MKLSLEVLTPGKSQGQSIPIRLSQFLIGRDAQCQLRPASALISNRHCALLIKDNKVFVRDFDSTNGTFVNEEAVKGEREIRDQDLLKVGPLLFRVRVEATAPQRSGTVPVSKPTPPPATKAATSDEEDIAAILLAVGDDNSSPQTVGPDGVPAGSTVMEIPVQPPTEESNKDGSDGKPTGKTPTPPPKKAAENTSVAAKAILEKYMRRPRG
jgi:pSer/pThr/pTyr-binding forkhead associated (FHA) protein